MWAKFYEIWTNHFVKKSQFTFTCFEYAWWFDAYLKKILFPTEWWCEILQFNANFGARLWIKTALDTEPSEGLHWLVSLLPEGVLHSGAHCTLLWRICTRTKDWQCNKWRFKSSCRFKVNYFGIINTQAYLSCRFSCWHWYKERDFWMTHNGITKYYKTFSKCVAKSFFNSHA